MMDRKTILLTIAEQGKEWFMLRNESPKVTCPCGKQRAIGMLYKCLYCDIFFCRICAAKHFKEMKTHE